MKTWLYLGRRDKKGFRLLATFNNTPIIGATRVQDIKTLNLSQEIENALSATVYENRMMWELWIESANSFDDLKTALRTRGYSRLPLHADPTHTPRTVVVDRNSGRKMAKSNQTKTMLRKKK
jgi:hypothetical protein